MGVNWNISVGEIATVLSIIAGAVGMFFGVKSDVRVVKHDLHSLNDKVALMATAWSKLGDILTQVAVQDTRINRVEEDVRELRHGEGMVIPRQGGLTHS